MVGSCCCKRVLGGLGSWGASLGGVWMGSGSGELHYVKAGQWSGLPDWAKAYIGIGAALACVGSPASRVVCAAAIPSRTCAAALAALGVVRASLLDPRTRIDKHKHFDCLKKLPRGTKVRLIDNGLSMKGVLDGLSTFGGKDYLRIQIKNKGAGGLSPLVDVEKAIQVEVVTADDWDLPKTKSGSPMKLQKSFLDEFLGPAQAQLITSSRLECVIVGRLSTLKEEVKDISFGVPLGSGDFAMGTLQDLMRARAFLPFAQPFRSDVISASVEDAPALEDRKAARVAIFDGALSFLKRRHHWMGSNWLVLLDRTEPQFEAGASAVNDEYVQSRLENGLGEIECNLPEGVETVVFEAPRR